jgi:hypothetical protein
METEICESCGGPVVRVVYGIPDENLLEAASAGLVALGGCMIWPDNPTWKCLNCGLSGRYDPPLEHEEGPAAHSKRAVLTRPQPGESKEEFKERVIAALFGTPKPTEQDRDST